MIRKILPKKSNSQSGYTLIEVLVSISIFSLVLVVALGSILTIVDANRKSRTLASVMNNVHYTVEYITRALKTGKDISVSGSESKVSVDLIDLEEEDFTRTEDVSFYLLEDDEKGKIVKRVGIDGDPIPLTSPEVDIDFLKFSIFGDTVDDKEQPRVVMYVGDSVQIGARTQSKFNVQTTVSQRDLDF